ncbi:MAG: proline dehydrogenase family protein [Acidobacteriota bacterium]|nr:proline dehydrogenase family protein [Acidobacteriota bacterium]
MRGLFLFLSRQRQLRQWMETSSLARGLSSRFVAGDTLPEALDVTRAVNREGIAVTLDRLGENVTSLEEAARSRDVYLEALSEISACRVDANVSLKLSQFGIDISEEACRENVAQLAAAAAKNGSFVRVDMESSAYTDRTLRLVTALHGRFGAVGAVIQAYLYRSEKDIDCLCRERIRVRLCKGAYLEPTALAFPSKTDVDRNFMRLAKKLLAEGTYPAIATHDERMISETIACVKSDRIASDSFEFQMLYGIRRDLQKRLVAEGYRLRLYVPFGRAWYPYFMRRLAERPANVLFLARNLFRE